MKTKYILILSVALVTLFGMLSCKTGCDPKEGPQTVGFVGVVPPDTDKVMAAAEIECGRKIRGTVRFLEDIPTCGGFPPTPPYKYAGCQNGDCWMLADVLYLPKGSHHNTVFRTALAHEIGHWCFPKYSEAEADAFSARVHQRVLNGGALPEEELPAEDESQAEEYQDCGGRHARSTRSP